MAACAFVDSRLSYATFKLAAPGMFTRRELAALSQAPGTEVAADTPDFDSWADDAGMRRGRPARA